MKIGILTFHAALNTGAVLQAYALQNYLRKLGHEAELINYRRPKKKNTINSFIARNPVEMFNKWKDRFNASPFEKQKIDFGEILQRGARLYTSLKELQENPPEYDTYIAGSDQIWNIGSNRNVDEVYYLSFGLQNVKRISYAASMGQCNIPESLNIKILELLKKFDVISLRETKAVNYVQSLFGNDKKIHHVPDPTFLLLKDDYLKLIDKSNHNGEYIASYCLAKYNHEQIQSVDLIRKTQKLPLINLRNPDTCIRLAGAKNKIVTPKEWLTYIYYSEFMICCSFHAVVFSLIFHKPFVVITPYENERISSLLNPLGLSDRISINYDQDKLLALIKSGIDWKHIDRLLEQERMKGVAFIQQYL